MKAIVSALLLIASSAIAGAPVKNPPQTPLMPPPGCPPISYGYVEVGYIHQDFDGHGTADGGYLDLNVPLIENLFLDASGTLTGGDVDYKGYSVGLGYAIPLSERFHFVARSGYGYTDLSTTNGEHEWYLSPGIRALITCDLEFYTKAYYHMGEHEDSWSGGAGFVYAINENLGLDLGGAVGENGNWQALVGLRFNF